DSDYSVRLKEKQRLRAIYNIRESQMVRYFNEARRRPGLAGENLVEILESRLDALVLRAGFARTIAQARQMVVHQHILVDGQRVDRPSFQVSEGQLIHVAERSESMVPFQIAAIGVNQGVLPCVPCYLDLEIEKLRGTLARDPKRAEIPVSIQENPVVEHYSRQARRLYITYIHYVYVPSRWILHW